MSETARVRKEEVTEAVGPTDREAAEVAEAIKALEMQLADLRKIVRAAGARDSKPAPEVSYN